MFKVGDRVHIKIGTRYYGKARNNPDASVIGSVTRVGSSFDTLHIDVVWDNGTSNCYHGDDLCLISSAENHVAVNSESYSRSRKIKKEDKAIIKAYLDSL